MNFINDRELARRFKAGLVPSRERLYYFLIFMMIMTGMVTSYGMSLLQTPINQWDIATDILALTSTLVGSLFLYRTNAKGDNKEFIERYICLSFPILVHVFLLAFVLGVALGIVFIMGILTIDIDNPATTVYGFGITALLMGYFYFRMNQSLKIASHSHS